MPYYPTRPLPIMLHPRYNPICACLPRYYTDFMDLRNQLATSQYFEFAEALPPRHPFGLVVERVLYLKKFWMKNEAPFLKERMQALTSWLNSMLVSIGPDGVDDVDFLDRFFEAFSPGDSRAAGQARLNLCNDCARCSNRFGLGLRTGNQPERRIGRQSRVSILFGYESLTWLRQLILVGGCRSISAALAAKIPYFVRRVPQGKTVKRRYVALLLHSNLLPSPSTTHPFIMAVVSWNSFMPYRFI